MADKILAEFAPRKEQFIETRLYFQEEKVGEASMKLSPRKKEMLIQAILVKRAYRGRGLGSLLLSHAEEIAQREKVERLALKPFSLEDHYLSDANLEAWYSKRGYKHHGSLMLKPTPKLEGALR